MNPASDVGDNQLLCLAIRSTALVAIMAITGITLCVMHADYRAADAIAHGADPVATACAIKGASEMCALAAAMSK